MAADVNFGDPWVGTVDFQFNHHFLLIGNFSFLPADMLGWPPCISTPSAVSSKRSFSPHPDSELYYLFLGQLDLTSDL